jgi:hypothetical protein
VFIFYFDSKKHQKSIIAIIGKKQIVLITSPNYIENIPPGNELI